MRTVASPTATSTCWESTSRRLTNSRRRSPQSPPAPDVQSRAVNKAGGTGAARGMGRETARRLAARGYQVLVTDLNEAGARETAELIGNGAWAMAQDVRDGHVDVRVGEAQDRAVACLALERLALGAELGLRVGRAAA